MAGTQGVSSYAKVQSFFDTLVLQCQITREWRGVKTDMENGGHCVKDQGTIGGEQLEGQFRKDFFLLSPPFFLEDKGILQEHH